MLIHLNKANLKRQSQVRAAKLENPVKICSPSKVTRELQNKEGLFLTLSDWQKSKCDSLSLSAAGKGCSHLLPDTGTHAAARLRPVWPPSLTFQVLTPGLRTPFHSYMLVGKEKRVLDFQRKEVLIRPSTLTHNQVTV